MSFPFSLSKNADFTISVKTGNRLGSGTDANVKIILKDAKGNLTEELTLDNICRDDLEKGQLDTFPIHTSNGFGNDISEIDFWRDNAGYNSGWYVDRISIENMITQATYVFPVYRWIKADYHYIIRHLDTSLPQSDPYRKRREEELKEKAKMYDSTVKFVGGPLQVTDLPADEKFLLPYKFDMEVRKLKMKTVSGLNELIKEAEWESLDDLTRIYSGAFGKPKGLSGWKCDVHFGLQRISSVNHSLIELCKSIPKNFGTTKQELTSQIQHTGCALSVQEAIQNNRLFKTDLKILQGIPLKSKEYKMTVPIALFFLNDNSQLVPIAIQLFQEKNDKNPVFFPTDPENTWLMAKMWYNLADSSYHQSLTHLGLTHLIMEGIVIATNRQLSQTHPIFKLLAPHFMYLLAINSLGLTKLISPDGWVDNVMTLGVTGMKALIAKGISTWRLDTDGTLTADLERRNLLDPDILPGYHFRDDALLLHQAIHNYVSEYVNLYYDTSEKICQDYEIINWGKELTESKEKGGCGMLGVPKEGKFSTTIDLIMTLTPIIYTCSVAHAATNFPQYDEYAFVPNYPAFLKGTPPTNKTSMTLEQILKTLPNTSQTYDTMTVAQLLSEKGTNSLGDFERQYICDPHAMQIVDKFREKLKQISKTIKARNEKRESPYEWLDPEIVPNSISI